MVNENLIPKTETVYELKNEIPNFEEFMKSYEPNRKVEDSYESEIKSYGNIGDDKGYGPTYYPIYSVIKEGEQIPKVDINTIFSIHYEFDEGYYPENRRFFKFGEKEYSTVWRINGNLGQIYREQDRIEEGNIQIVKQAIKTSGSFSSTSNHVGFERTEKEEEEVKRQLRKDIRFFELAARNGERIHPSTSGVFRWEHAYNNVCYWKEQVNYHR